MKPAAWVAFGLILGLLCGPAPAYAPTHASSGPDSAEYHERMFARCLGGMTILVGKRLYQCLPMGYVS